MLASVSILYQDEAIVAINKPAGLLVHRSKRAANADTFALQLLRDQLQQYVYPIHRLDRKTSGVLLFALKKEVAAAMGKAFAERNVQKTYLAIVRGWLLEPSTVSKPLLNLKQVPQAAATTFIPLRQIEIPLPFGKHDTSRYSLVKAMPQTGRMHQIRRHLNHLRHPIIGDRPHGCNKQNRLFKEKFHLSEMLLHASVLEFLHPTTQKTLTIQAPLSPEFERIGKLLDLL